MRHNTSTRKHQSAVKPSQKRAGFLLLGSIIWLSSTSNCAGVGAETISSAQTGKHYENTANWRKAIESYNQELALSPRDAHCLARRGYAHARLGNFKQSFVDFSAAMEADSACPDAYSRRARVYTGLGFIQLAKQDAQKALTLIGDAPSEPNLLLEHAGLLYIVENKQVADLESKRVLDLCKTNKDSSTLLNLAGAHFNLGDFKDTVYYTTQALCLEPTNSYLHLIRGAACYQLRQYSMAVTDLNCHINNELIAPMALCARGDCYMAMGNYQKALADYELALKQAPNYVYALRMHGRAQHRLGRLTNAVDDFARSIALDPTDAYSYAERAYIYCQLKQGPQALKDAQQAIILKSDYAFAYRSKAWAYELQGQFEKAIEEYTRAIELAQNNSEGYYDRGLCYRSQKKYANAIADLTTAIKYSPDDAFAYCARGSALVSNHQYEQAIADCTRSLQLRERAHPHLSRGIAYARLGKYKSAIKDFNEAIRQVHDYGEAYYERSLVYKALKMKTMAASDFKFAKSFGYQSPEAMR